MDPIYQINTEGWTTGEISTVLVTPSKKDVFDCVTKLLSQGFLMSEIQITVWTDGRDRRLTVWSEISNGF